MAQSELKTYINRPQDEVFDYISNPANSHQWQSRAESAAWISDGPPGVGSTFKMVVKNLGRQTETEAEITGWDPPKLLSNRSENGPVVLEGRTVLTAQGDGTLVTYTSQTMIRGMFKIADGLVSGWFKKRFEENLIALKSVLENG